MNPRTEVLTRTVVPQSRLGIHLAIVGALLLITLATSAEAEELRYRGEPLVVSRDSYGVPHITAATLAAAYYGAGYVMAQDRLHQLDRFRRDAKGTLAEVDGAAALEHDEHMRRLGYSEAELRNAFSDLSPTVRTACDAYAAGVNQFLETQRVPAIAPWEVTDTLAIAVMMAHRFGASGGQELANAALLRRLEQQYGSNAIGIFNDLFYKNDPYAPATIGGPVHARPTTLLLPSMGADLRPAHSAATQQAVYRYAELHDLPTTWGSYGWVVGPSKTTTRTAMLVGGPQMGFTAPSIAYEIAMRYGGHQIAGMTFPGVPAVLIGATSALAWTSTSGNSDMVDIFVERLDPANKYRYWHQGQYKSMDRRTEVIAVRGGPPRHLEVARTVHGPLVAWDEKHGVAYSRAAAFAGRELEGLEAVFRFHQARTLDDFEAATARVATNHNFLVATRDGNIGFWHAGPPPQRVTGHDGRLPVPGTGEFDWKGRVSILPSARNPRSGYLANWNNKPTPDWENGDRPNWGAVHRVERIFQLLHQETASSVDNAIDVLRDISTYDVAGQHLVPFLMQAVGNAKLPSLANHAIDVLRDWDYHATAGSIGKVVFDAWFSRLRDRLFADEFGDLLAEPEHRAVLEPLLSPTLLKRVLQGQRSGIAFSRDYLNGASRDQVLIHAFLEAVERLERERGGDMNTWHYAPPPLAKPPLDGLPQLQRGTYIQIVHFANGQPDLLTALPPGQNERPGSAHYEDQVPLARSWCFKRLNQDADNVSLEDTSPEKDSEGTGINGTDEAICPSSLTTPKSVCHIFSCADLDAITIGSFAPGTLVR